MKNLGNSHTWTDIKTSVRLREIQESQTGQISICLEFMIHKRGQTIKCLGCYVTKVPFIIS